MALPSPQTTGLDFTSFDAALKVIYSKQAVVDETYKNRPLHAIMPKDTDFTGRFFVQDVISSLPQGRSAAFANAQANKSGLQVDQFTILRAYDFALASVDLWTMYASADDKGALLDALTSAINGARGSLMRSIAIAEFRDGTGAIGRAGTVVTGVSGTVILTQQTDIVNFEKSQSITFWNPTNFLAGTSTQRTGGGVTKSIVQSVNRVTYTITFDNVPSDVTGASTNDYLVMDGDYSTQTVGGVTAFAKLSGLAAWLPYGGPSSTAFMGLDRTSDTVRLAGWSSNQIGKSEDEALQNASYEAFMYGGANVDHAFVSPNRWNNISKLLGPARRYVDAKATSGTLGFQALEVMGQGGPIKVLADPNCPDNRGYLLQLDTWKLKSLGALPRFLNPNSKTLLEQTANRVEIRCGYAAQAYTKAPGYNAVLSFAT